MTKIKAALGAEAQEFAMAIDVETPTGLEPHDVRRLCGEILDWKVDAILASGATESDLEVAVAWLTGADEATHEARAPIAGKAAVVYDLLAGGEDFLGDEDAAAPGRRD